MLLNFHQSIIWCRFQSSNGRHCCCCRSDDHIYLIRFDRWCWQYRCCYCWDSLLLFSSGFSTAAADFLIVWLVLVCWCNVHSPCCPILPAVVVPATETISSFEDSNDRSVTLSFSICSMLAVRLLYLFLGIDFSMILSNDLSSSVLLLLVDRTAVSSILQKWVYCS